MTLDFSKKRAALNLVIGVLCFFASLSSALDIALAEYQALRTVSREVAQEDNALVIGIGRSPGPVISFLKQQKPSSAINLPLSSFRYQPNGPHSSDPDYMKYLYRPLSAEEKERLFIHFDKFIPSAALIGTRKLLLVDYSERGDSLFATKAYLTEYFKAWGRNHEISLVAMAKPENVAEIQRRAAIRGNQIRIIKLEDSSFRNHLDSQLYDQYSEFGRFDISDHENEQLSHRREYDEFGRAIEFHMERDPTIFTHFKPRLPPKDPSDPLMRGCNPSLKKLHYLLNPDRWRP